VLATDTNAMDIIFCRNVMMYFTGRRRGTSCSASFTTRWWMAGGWRAVPAKRSHTLFPQFVRVNFPPARSSIKKSRTTSSAEHRWTPAPRSEIAGVIAARDQNSIRHRTPAVLLAEARPLAPANRPASGWNPKPPPLPPRNAFLPAGRYAGGRHHGPLRLPAARPAGRRFPCWRERSRTRQTRRSLDVVRSAGSTPKDRPPPATYLRAVVLLEQAIRSKRVSACSGRSTLDPDFVLAQFAPGQTSRAAAGARARSSNKHSTTAQLRALIGRRSAAESDGLTAGPAQPNLTAITGSSMSPMNNDEPRAPATSDKKQNPARAPKTLARPRRAPRARTHRSRCWSFGLARECYAVETRHVRECIR